MENKKRLIISACLAALATYLLEMLDVLILTRPPLAGLNEIIIFSISLLLIFLAGGYIIALLEIVCHRVVVIRYRVDSFIARLMDNILHRREAGVYLVSSLYAVVAFLLIFPAANYALTFHLLKTRHNRMMISFSQTALSIVVLFLCVFIAWAVFMLVKNLSGKSAARREIYSPSGFIFQWTAIPLFGFLGIALAVLLRNIWWLKRVLDFRLAAYAVIFFALQAVAYRYIVPRYGILMKGPRLRLRWLFTGLGISVCIAVIGVGMISKGQNVKMIARGKTTVGRRLIAFFYPLERGARLSFFSKGVLVPGPGAEKIMDRVREINDYAWSVRSSIPQLKGAKDWNVIYLTIEALRADHMSCYGYKRKTTPRLDRFASENVFFRRAYVQAGSTHAGLPSVMTGTYITSCNDKFLNKVTLPEIMRSAGYETAVVFDEANFVHDPLRRGIKTYNETKVPWDKLGKASTANIINRLALDYIRSTKGKKFFMWMHYWEPHLDYMYHPEFPFGNKKNAMDRYDSEIGRADHYVGIFLDNLRRMGLMDKTIICITADHGEEFFEHGDGAHGRQLYEESIHVPLIMHIPGVGHEVIDQPVAQFNVMPTILNILGFNKPAQLQAISLVPLIYLKEEQRNMDIFCYVPLPYKDVEKQGVVSGDWKLIYDAVKDSFELYNLQDDPGEKRNLFDDKPEKAREMQAKLLAHMRLSGYGRLTADFRKPPPEKKEKVATLKEPRAIAIDRSGNAYVADFRNYEVKKYSPELKLVKQWGDKGKEPGEFNDPSGIALDSEGNIYVSDSWNHRIQKFDSDGRFLSQIKADLFSPSGLKIDEEGNIYVADTGNAKVKKLSPSGELIWQSGKRGSRRGEFNSSVDVALRKDGCILVTDSGNRRIQILDSGGRFKGAIPVDGWQKRSLNLPYIDLDSEDNIYITDPFNNRALKLSPRGKLLGILRPQKGKTDIMSNPTGIALDEKRGVVYIVDTGHHCIRKYSIAEFKPRKGLLGGVFK